MKPETSLENSKKILARTAELTERNAKLIGDLGNKFGSFTEGMAIPSMEKVLRKQSGVTTITTKTQDYHLNSRNFAVINTCFQLTDGHSNPRQ